MGSSQLGVASAVQRGSTTCLHAFQCDKNAKPAEGEWAANDNPQWGVHMGLGNAQQGEVEWMRREGIPIYAYTVDEYAELVELAAKKEGVPSSRLFAE